MDDASPSDTHAPDPLTRAMAHVEAHPLGPLTLADLAAVAGLSPYHFARQFNARFGLAPMAFVRARRLGLAARALVGADPPNLVDLAFDSGFESQEGFTRAFKRVFGVSPGRYRAGKLAPLPYPMESAMSEATTVRVSQGPAPVRKPGFRVAGVSAVFDETNKAGIPALWGRLEPRLPIPGQVGRRTFGVGCPTEEAKEGCFRYAAAVEIGADSPAPQGLEAFDIPEQTYLIFRLETDGSELHPQMQAAMRDIWGTRVPASGLKLVKGPDLEVYPPDFEPNRPGSIEWWIPVEA